MTTPPETQRPRSFEDVLRRIRVRQAASEIADLKTTREEEDLARQQQQAQLQGIVQDIEERKKYASRTFWLVVVWLSIIGVIVFLQGFKLWGFELPATVLMTLIGSTTGSVFGIFLIVTRYLFPRR